ncbi:hypothetical protein HPB50_013833 [Hyalomma asiaticum]|uniref:Uncharacterized protein n=1 Tax=Hyalomma asiaticum TaxID=266040 RepID=A0ACB7SFA5_HYAAI|nr:hypothetical protein HPB50_013833 [Hyalomma asiaticum]
MATPKPRKTPAPNQITEITEDIIDKFARFIYAEDRDVFQNVERLKRYLRLAEKRFLASRNHAMSLFGPCTQTMEGYCWLFKRYLDVNSVILPHGFEMIIIRGNAFAVQTLENSEDIITRPDELFAMCICNWLLREHSCIARVVLNVATVARFHAPLFWRLLSLNVLHLNNVELIGLPTDESHFRFSRGFENATRLAEIVLVHIRLSDDQVSLLCEVLTRNVALQKLVLKYGHLSAVALELLGGAISEHGRPTFFELREETPSCELYADAVASLLDTPVRRMCLDAPCNWAELFKRLRCNKLLSDLEIIDCDSLMHSSLHYLADSLLENSTLTRLKLSIRFPELNPCIKDHWCQLTKSIGQNRNLKWLSFASTEFCEEDSVMTVSLAEAIAQNKSLVDISVEDCDLSLASFYFLLDGLARNDSVKTLHFGELRKYEELNRSILDRVVEMGLEERVDCLCVMRSEWVLKWSQDECERTPIRRVRLLYTSALSESRILNILHRAQDKLTQLYVEGSGDVQMSTTAAIHLADLLANSHALEHVTLLFDADDTVAVKILIGLASSKTIYSVVVGRRWKLSREVMTAFQATFRRNSSIAELTVWQDDRTGYEELKRNIIDGLISNTALQKVRLLYGPEQKEARDPEMFAILQFNRGYALCVAGLILGGDWIVEGMVAFLRVCFCDNFRAVMRRATGFSDEEIDSKLVEVSKRAERPMLIVAPPVPQIDMDAAKLAEKSAAVRGISKDFVERVKIFLQARKPPPAESS